MFIDGIGISGYRSFGQEVQRIGPFKKINLIIGQNNSGKSNILRFLKDHYRSIADGKSPKLEELDRPVGGPATEESCEIGLCPDGDCYQQLMERLAQGRGDLKQVVDKVRTILTSDMLTKETELIWFPRIVDEKISQEFHDANILPNNEWRVTWSNLTGTGGGGILVPHFINTTTM